MAVILCRIIDCGVGIKTKKSGLCQAHYARDRRGLDLETPVKRWKTTSPTSRVCTGCELDLLWSEFSRNVKSPNQKSSRCRSCSALVRGPNIKSEQSREKEHQRRVMFRGGSVSRVDISTLRQRQKDCCHYCKIEMSFVVMREYNPLRASIEHVIPISQEGKHDMSNVVLACLGCNLSKNNRPVEEWLAWL